MSTAKPDQKATRSQRLAQAAYGQIQGHVEPKSDPKGKVKKEYVTFAKKFPALIHTCGLAQAVAFAMAKKETDYVGDLALVLKASGHPEVDSAEALSRECRKPGMSEYLRLSRDAINAASWLKRYVEAVSGGEDD